MDKIQKKVYYKFILIIIQKILFLITFLGIKIIFLSKF